MSDELRRDDVEGGSIGGRLAGENVGRRSDDVEGGGIGPGIKIPTVDCMGMC